MPTTDPLIEVIARAQYVLDHEDATETSWDLHAVQEVRDAYLNDAREVYAAVQASGRLLGPGAVIVATTETAGGFEERVEWSTQATVRDGGGPTVHEHDARAWLRHDARWAATNPDLPVALLRRTVYTGPWEVAP